jgi:two-component system, chemotaxis family, protein-glutamate methylesterase/glutaminase
MSPVRVLIVDDSATMRGLIKAVLSQDPDIEVIGTAADPLEARAAIKSLNPDVITLDIEMPNMNGLEFLEKIMRLRPMPVIMVSTLTQNGAVATLKALEIGAFDCVGKPMNGVAAKEAFAELTDKVKAAARAKMRAFSQSVVAKPQTEGFRSDGRVLAIGSSTGGVEALLAIISQFPVNCPPTVITQHMPASFTASFAERLNRSCAASVSEAKEGAALEVGQIYLAPGGAQHLEVSGVGPLRCRLKAADLVNGHRPSVDVLFESVARTVGGQSVGLILTGMGRDGARGLLAMREAGASTLGQDEASSVVYGMPRVAFEMGAVERQAPLERLGSMVLNLCNLDRRERA